MVVTAIAKHIIAKRNEFQNLKSVPFFILLKKANAFIFSLSGFGSSSTIFSISCFFTYTSKLRLHDKGKLLKLFSFFIIHTYKRMLSSLIRLTNTILQLSDPAFFHLTDFFIDTFHVKFRIHSKIFVCQRL